MTKRTQLAVVLCVAVAPVGCRSGVPGFGRFAKSSEPSAELLAGSGPTATYPVPPSHSATPSPIDSIVAGTGTPVPETVSPAGNGYPTYSNPAGAAGAIAAAKPTPGFGQTQLASADRSPSIRTASSISSPSNPYANLPPANATTPPMDAAVANGYAAIAGTAPPSSAVAQTSGSDNLTDSEAPSEYTPVPWDETPSPASAGGGFTFPGAAVASAATTQPASGFAFPGAPPAPAANAPAAMTAGATSGSLADAPGESQPVAEVASAPKPLGGGSTRQAPGNSYMPGSTGSASAYPGASVRR